MNLRAAMKAPPPGVKTFRERSGAHVLLWTVGALLVQGLISGLAAWEMPAWATPILPALVAALTAVHAYAKTQSVDVTAYGPEFQGRVRDLLDQAVLDETAGLCLVLDCPRRRVNPDPPDLPITETQPGSVVAPPPAERDQDWSHLGEP